MLTDLIDDGTPLNIPDEVLKFSPEGKSVGEIEYEETTPDTLGVR